MNSSSSAAPLQHAGDRALDLADASRGSRRCRLRCRSRAGNRGCSRATRRPARSAFPRAPGSRNSRAPARLRTAGSAPPLAIGLEAQLARRVVRRARQIRTPRSSSSSSALRRRMSAAPVLRAGARPVAVGERVEVGQARRVARGGADRGDQLGSRPPAPSRGPSRPAPRRAPRRRAAARPRRYIGCSGSARGRRRRARPTSW